MRKLLLAFALACCTTFTAGQALAVPMLTIDGPIGDRVSAGSNFEILIGITGMEPGVDLGAFSFDLYFTPKNDVANWGADWLPHATSFGGQLGSPNPLDLETIVGITESDYGVNSALLKVFEVSLLWDLSGQANDPDPFDLITFGFYTPRFSDPANRALNIFVNNIVLSDAFGNQIGTDQTLGKRIIVVPEPATLALFALGLVGVGLAKRSRGFY